jgi:hypothetical protein
VELVHVTQAADNVAMRYALLVMWAWAMPAWARYEDLYVAYGDEPVVSAFGPYAELKLALIALSVLSVAPVMLGRQATAMERVRAGALLACLCVGFAFAPFITLGVVGVLFVAHLLRP